jgi:hypothetical protein
LLAEARELGAGLAQHLHALGLDPLAPALEHVVADEHAEQAGEQDREQAAGDVPHRLQLEGDADDQREDHADRHALDHRRLGEPQDQADERVARRRE